MCFKIVRFFFLISMCMLLCICTVVLELGFWQNKPSIRLLCSDGALYSSPYYTDGTITARPIAAASLGPKGPHMWNETSVAITFVCLSHLSFPVFLISTPHPPASTPKPPPSSFLSSATRQIKSLSIMTQMRVAHL